MKLLRYGPKDHGEAGPLGTGKWPHPRPVRPARRDCREALSPEGCAGSQRSIRPACVNEGSPRLGPPLARVGKFIAIGLNFSDHAAESNLPIPSEPVVFTKATSCITGPFDPVTIPRGSNKHSTGRSSSAS
ncbi:MAG: fumarylacetoacetate hydrolase family protein [Geminicoccaceae bacterium]